MIFSKILLFIRFPNLGFTENIKNKMPKKKVYTIGQIVDAFYSNKSPEKLRKMAETLLTKKKQSNKKHKI